MAQIQRHPYHLVDQSPWPLTGALGCLFAIPIGTGALGCLFWHPHWDRCPRVFILPSPLGQVP